MMRRRAFHATAVLAGLFCAALASTAAAQVMVPSTGSGDGISVYGIGEVAGRPNCIELDLQVNGKAELTADALVKHRDAKKRASDALADLKIEGLSLAEFGLAISAGSSAEQQQRAMQGMPAVASRPQVEVGSTLRVKLVNVRDTQAEDLMKTIGKILDTAQDAGLAIGPSAADLTRMMRYGQQVSNTTVRFIVADLGALREQAYEKAVADARSRAQRLAKLHQVRLGAAQFIQEVQVSGDVPTAQQYSNPQQPVPPYDGEEPRLIASTLSGLPVQVRLLVRFAIERQPDTAQH